MAIGKVVLNKKERLVTLTAYKGNIQLQTLKFYNEIRELPEFKADVDSVNKEELELTLKLMDKMTLQDKEFKLSDYSDTYESALMQLIKDKIAGKSVTVNKSELKTPEKNALLSILQQSLNSKQEETKMESE